MSAQTTTTVTYPQGKDEAGPHFWSVLFNSASLYPDEPSKEDRSDVNNYIKATIKRFTCDDCIQHSFQFIREHPIQNENRKALMEWLCKLKNNANRHEGKPEVDCGSFAESAIDKKANTNCRACTIEPIRAPITTLPPKVEAQPVTIPQQPQSLGPVPYTEDNSWMLNYPSFSGKMAMNLNPASAYQTAQSQTYMAAQATPPPMPVPVVPPQNFQPPDINQLAGKYPSLAAAQGMMMDSVAPQEPLEGVLRPIDNLYAGPASVVGIPAEQMNLAYTPEILTNGVSLLTQMYMTNAGAMITTLLASVGMITASVFAKNSIRNYDRLFLQNVAGSFLFHTLNFLNPRGRDDLMPDLQKLMEGVTKMDMNKIKEALLYNAKDEGKVGSSKHAEKLLEMVAGKKGLVDMKKLAKNHSDLRGTHGSGHGSTGGTLTRAEFDAMMEDGGPLSDDIVNFSSAHDSLKYDFMM